MLAGFRNLSGRTLCDGARSGTEITAVAQRIEPDTEDRPGRKCSCSSTLVGNRGRAGHFDAPCDGFAIGAAYRFAVRSERDEMDLGVICLSDESRHDSRQRDGFALVVHRERVMRYSRRYEHDYACRGK